MSVERGRTGCGRLCTGRLGVVGWRLDSESEMKTLTPQLRGLPRAARRLTILAVMAGMCLTAYGAERVTLRNGFDIDCSRREVTGARVRLYLLPETGAQSMASGATGQGVAGDGTAGDGNYIEIDASAVLRVEEIPDPVPAAIVVPAAGSLHPSIPQERGMDAASGAAALTPAGAPTPASYEPTPEEMSEMLSRAGVQHNIDADLLASVVAAESGGNARAVSRAGAEGLMQLMPGTASDLGVRDAFAPEENIGGGTAYLDAMLMRYHNDMKLAVAAYNAGPAAVDRYHGIPPYAETQAYVARVIREFNRRKRAAWAAQRSLMTAAK